MNVDQRRWTLTNKGHSSSIARSSPDNGPAQCESIRGGIANLGAQVIARQMLHHGWNCRVRFADTCRAAAPFLANLATPGQCQLIAVSIPVRRHLPSRARMLRAASVAAWSADRGEDDPVVVAGGMGLINPMHWPRSSTRW